MSRNGQELKGYSKISTTFTVNNSLEIFVVELRVTQGNFTSILSILGTKSLDKSTGFYSNEQKREFWSIEFKLLNYNESYPSFVPQPLQASWILLQASSISRPQASGERSFSWIKSG